MARTGERARTRRGEAPGRAPVAFPKMKIAVREGRRERKDCAMSVKIIWSVSIRVPYERRDEAKAANMRYDRATRRWTLACVPESRLGVKPSDVLGDLARLVPGGRDVDADVRSLQDAADRLDDALMAVYGALGLGLEDAYLLEVPGRVPVAWYRRKDVERLSFLAAAHPERQGDDGPLSALLRYAAKFPSAPEDPEALEELMREAGLRWRELRGLLEELGRYITVDVSASAYDHDPFC